jgi:hypothetical protein
MAESIPLPPTLLTPLAPPVLENSVVHRRGGKRPHQVPESWLCKFMELHKQMEAATGQIYEVNVKRFNVGRDEYPDGITIGSIKNRGPIEVYNMIPIFTDLAGRYESVYHAQLAMQQLRDIIAKTSENPEEFGHQYILFSKYSFDIFTQERMHGTAVCGTDIGKYRFLD